LKNRATKKVRQHIFSSPLFVFVGSGIREEEKIRIRDEKKSGSGMNIPDLQHW
jgi:hypothetical protein